jgi:hypothetical protein
MRVLHRVVVATLSTALVLLGTSFVLAPAAHADCLMIGHADLGAAAQPGLSGGLQRVLPDVRLPPGQVG